MCTKLQLIGLFLLFKGCVAPLMLPTEQDVVRAQSDGNDVSLETLKKGYSLYQNKCGGCHYLYRPAKFSEEKWKSEMPKMSEKSKITTEEQEIILNYLLTMQKSALIHKHGIKNQTQ